MVTFYGNAYGNIYGNRSKRWGHVTGQLTIVLDSQGMAAVLHKLIMPSMEHSYTD
jgi:hypothetical protein